MHTLFYRIEWASHESLRSLYHFFTVTCAAPEDWQTAALDAVQACVADPAIVRALAKPSASAVLWRERPFEAIIGQQRISGVFDRVTIEYDESGRPIAAHLIECKTDHLRNEQGAIGAGVMRHSPQIQLYRAALGPLTGLPQSKITASVLFTSLPRLVSCAD